MKTIPDTNWVSNLLKSYLSAEYCFEEFLLRNNEAVAVVDLDIAGVPVILDPDAGTAVLATAATLAGANGLCVTRGKLSIAAESNTENKVAILVRGPAVIYEEGLPVKDPYDTAYDLAVYETFLKAMSPLCVLGSKDDVLSAIQTT